MAERDDDAGSGDEYERDLKRDNQRDRQHHTMGDLADTSRRSARKGTGSHTSTGSSSRRSERSAAGDPFPVTGRAVLSAFRAAAVSEK